MEENNTLTDHHDAKDVEHMHDVLHELHEHNEEKKRLDYSKLRNEREKATFTMMMKMNPSALTAIRKEFYVREDSIDLQTFIYIIQKHLMGGASHHYRFESKEQREFGTNMYELFKDIDVNGDGDLEWQEFTSFVVEKANIINKRIKLASIPQYHDVTNTLDPTAYSRHQKIAKLADIPTLGRFCMIEESRNAFFMFNSRTGKHIKTVPLEASPIAIEHVAAQGEILASSFSNMTIATYSLNDPNLNRRYAQVNSWSTPGVQMALTYLNDSKLLYSGSTNGNVYAWKIQDRELMSTFSGHSDIIMSLVGLKKLNNIASGSLDKSICVWDSYTNAQILKLVGHKKGILDLSYSPQYRLLFSCGFEHDACVWSPLGKNLVYRLKGHHASLTGVVAVEDTPEIITGDITGVFKLWDIRNFSCVQTFKQNDNDQGNSGLTRFFHTKLPPRNSFQKEDDYRIYAAKNNIYAFDQTRVVHGATTDYTNVFWMEWNRNSCQFITASENNVIVWDALIGSKTFTHSNIITTEISAACLDDRKRKMILGDVHGCIGVYNYSNGALMKTVYNDDNPFTVVALEYVDETKRFIAGFGNGIIRIYDENALEDCNVLRTFDAFNMHPELIGLSFNPIDLTVITTGAMCTVARLWDYMAGKCEVELKVADEDQVVVHVIYLHPYPIVATSDSKGNIMLWLSRKSFKPGARICGWMNQTPVSAELEPLAKISNDDEEEPPRRIFPTSGPVEMVFSDDEEDDDVSVDLDTKAKDDMTAVDDSDWTEEDSANSIAAAKSELKNAQDKWGPVTPANSIVWNPETYQLCTGDDLGYLRSFSVMNAIMDLGGKKLLNDNGSKCKVHNKCMAEMRTTNTACPAVLENPTRYLLSANRNAMAYLGVDFLWTIQAHEDRIIACRCTEHGILTSAADMLVKMWTYKGTPVGVLLQNVPVGIPARQWKLSVDVDTIREQEEEELDEIIENVGEIVADSDKPDIEDEDFSGMEPGVNAAEFTYSELRQRIEETSKKLGMDFTIDKGQLTLDQDDSIFDYGSVTSGSKSLVAALHEIKSPDGAVEYKTKFNKLSGLQQKQKLQKKHDVVKLFEKKAGMLVEDDGVRGGGSLIPVEEIGDLNDILSLSAKGEDRTQRDAMANADLYSTTSMTLEGSQSFVSSNVGQAQKNSSKGGQLQKTKLEASGVRADVLRKTCKKFDSYSALDAAMNRDLSKPIAKDLIEQRKILQQEKMKKLLESSSTDNDPIVPVKTNSNKPLTFSLPDDPMPEETN